MTKKFLKFIALALVGMLSATCMVACDKSEDDNTITIWAFDSSAEAAKKAVEIYNNAHPESTYQFDVVSLGQDDMDEKIKIALATNSKETLPDMFYDEDYNFAEYITYYGDLFYDLTSKVDIDNYYSYKSLNVTLDDKVYAVPYDSGTGVLFYRSDLIQKAGYNDSDMQNLTWSEFITIGQKVKETTGVDMIIMCPEGDMEGRLLYQSAGTWFFDENGKANITNNSAFADAIDTMNSAYEANIVYDAAGGDDYISAIANKKVASLVGASWWAPIFSGYSEQAGLWKIAQMPRMEGDEMYSNYSNLGGGNWFIINNENSEISSSFAIEMFGNNQELANYMAETYFVLPTNKNHVAGLTTYPSEFWCGQDITSIICDYNNHIPAVRYGLNTYEITYIVGLIAGEYIDGKVSFEEALNKMGSEAERIAKATSN